MKTSLTLLCAIVLLGFGQSKSDTYTGEIMDNQCAQMGTHDSMMKSEGAKNAKECALACVKNGDKFALYDAAAKKVYQLDDQKKARGFAGQKVTVTGKYDSGSDSIQVKSIEAAH